MRSNRPTIRPLRTVAVAALTVVLLAAGPCRVAEQDTVIDEAAQAEALAAQERLEKALAAELAATEAAQNALAEREALLEAREEQLQRQEEIAAQQARLTSRRAELERRERELNVRERELDNVEANLEFQEQELADREEEFEELLSVTDESYPESNSPVDDGYANGARGEAPGPGENAGFEPDRQPVSEPIQSDSGDETAPQVQASLEPGRLFEIEILETLTSRTSRVGDAFSARLVQDLTAEDGTLVVPAGAEVIGRVSAVTPLKKVGGRASLEVEFTHIVLSPTEEIAISASFVEFGVNKRKDKKKIAGAAIVGAILGRVLGGDTEAVLAGAAAGAAAGTAAVARAKGQDAEIPAGTTAALQLEEVVTVTIQMQGPAEDS